MKSGIYMLILGAFIFTADHAAAQAKLAKEALTITNGSERLPVDGVVRISRKWFDRKEVCLSDKRKSPAPVRVHALMVAEYQPKGPSRYFQGEGRCLNGNAVTAVKDLNPTTHFVIVQVKEGDPATPGSNVLHNLRIEFTD